MKLIISFLFLFLLSCEPISKKDVLTKIENTKNIIEEKTLANINEKKEKQNNIIKNNKNDNKKHNQIFYLIGDPYFIQGVKYIPEENYSYTEVGLATFYDKELHNKITQNNDLNKVTELLGRHKTLPLPSIVKITNLENGLYITIKIVDRHEDNASIIQVSRKVAQLLRFYKNKIAKVKVEILPDPSKQWKNVINSINDSNFNATVESAPTEIVSISNIDEDNLSDISNEFIEQPIEIGSEEVEDVQLFLEVNNFKNYQEIENIIKDINLIENYRSINNGSLYKIIIGPIDNDNANKLVSTFITKGYKDNKLILE